MGKRHEQIIYDELAVKYLSGNSLTKLAKESGITRRIISENFKRMGLEIINHQNAIRFNQSIFDEIDSEEKAYWLGFIFADGCIGSTNYCSKSNYRFELSLSLKDNLHLEKFAEFLGYKNLVKYDIPRNRVRCYFSNKHFWNILNSYGCTPQKSLTLEFPNESIFKSKDLIIHFIRGYFDGDGCITHQKNGNQVYVVVSLLGTPQFLDKIEEYLSFPEKITRCQDKRHSIDTNSLSFKCAESLILINKLYGFANIYLNRKYKLYSFFKNGCRLLKEFNRL